MSARDALQAKIGGTGRSAQLRLLPPLGEIEIAAFESGLAAKLPASARRMLAWAAGFVWPPFGHVSFVGGDAFEFRDMLPKSIPLAPDGEGNFWALDVRADTGDWGPVFFVSHDPPVAAIQARDLDDFVSQVLACEPGSRAPIEEVTKAAVKEIWLEDPHLMDIGVARASSDPSVSAFARGLGDSFRVADLRTRRRGVGFAWGCGSGGESGIVRHGSELLFGVRSQTRRSPWSRLTGPKDRRAKI
jgi:hypothetical protein